MNKICTSLEQSKKLMELGIDINTADMFYKYVLPKSDKIHHIPEIGNPINSLIWYNKGYTFRGKREPITLNEYCIPAWSLNALLELMPKDETKTISLCLGGSNGEEHTFDWFCTCDENDEPYDYKTFHSKSPIDCTFEMIVWIKEEKKGE